MQLFIHVWVRDIDVGFLVFLFFVAFICA